MQTQALPLQPLTTIGVNNQAAGILEQKAKNFNVMAYQANFSSLLSLLLSFSACYGAKRAENPLPYLVLSVSFLMLSLVLFGCGKIAKNRFNYWQQKSQDVTQHNNPTSQITLGNSIV